MPQEYTQPERGPTELGRMLGFSEPNYSKPREIKGLRARFEPDSKAEFRIMLNSLQRATGSQSGPSALGKILLIGALND